MTSSTPPQGMSPIGMDKPALRRMLGQFVTGVAVVSAADGERQECVTVNSFNAVSMEPPLVLFSLHQASSALPCFLAAQNLGISILHESAQAVSQLFASRERQRWQECDLERGRHGALLVKGAVARMECARFAVHEAGDHRIFVCQVLRFDYDEAAAPLVFFRGQYCNLGA
jgi:flavin reductase (DIM6/NTAB) family NADH-FMN oxidoreductase RutF